MIHESKEYLRELIHRFSGYLHSKLKLSLHPGKIYLQHYTKGVKFLGTVILPNRVYIANRTKGNFYNAIVRQNQIACAHSPCGIKRSFGKAIHPVE